MEENSWSLENRITESKLYFFFFLLGSSYYERLNDNENDGEIYNISSPIPPTSQVDGNTASYDNKPIAAKRSPLTRMKSDTLDVQKRAKFAKNTELANQNFRPISMMNLVRNIFSLVRSEICHFEMENVLLFSTLNLLVRIRSSKTAVLFLWGLLQRTLYLA